MFGHLKAEEFVNLMEGSDVSAKHKAHLAGCIQCRTTWQSMQSVHAEVASTDSDILEPDWGRFRSSVRDRLLSRSIQRQSTVRRWTGWAIRPATAWALSMFLVVGLTTVTVLWKTENRTAAPAVTVESPTPEPAAETEVEVAPDRALFDDLVQLGDEEQEQLRQMLESEQKGSTFRR
jgi:hypothetical protein